MEATARRDLTFRTHRELFSFLVPVGEEAPLLLVDLQIGDLKPDGLVRVAGEQQVLHGGWYGAEVAPASKMKLVLMGLGKNPCGLSR